MNTQCAVDPEALTPGERKKAGLKAAVTGGLMNVLLATAKLIAGAISGSIAISAEGWNNLSDSFSSLVSIVSIRLSAKPADKKHPFGYARFEYIASSVIALGMLTVAVQVGYRSVIRILYPEELDMGWLAFSALILSILVKTLQYFYYRKKGKELLSPVFIAASKDSLADIYATSGVLIATILYAFFAINVDGPAGLIVSLLIAWSAVDIMRNTLTILIGGKPSTELIALIRQKVMESDARILGIHDLIVHDYGPGNIFATAHVELDSRESFLEAHLIVDCVERKLLREHDIHLILHADPAYVGNAQHNSLHEKLEKTADELAKGAVIHSLHMFVSDTGDRVASFDVGVPESLSVNETEFFSRFREKVKAYDQGLVLWITLDRQYQSIVSDDRPNLRVTAEQD